MSEASPGCLVQPGGKLACLLSGKGRMNNRMSLNSRTTSLTRSPTSPLCLCVGGRSLRGRPSSSTQWRRYSEIARCFHKQGYRDVEDLARPLLAINAVVLPGLELQLDGSIKLCLEQPRTRGSTTLPRLRGMMKLAPQSRQRPRSRKQMQDGLLPRSQRS